MCGDYRGMRKVERHRGPHQGGTGSLEGFMGTWVVQETLGGFGKRRGLCGLYVHKIPPAVGLRLGEGQGQKQGDQVEASTVI